MSFMWCGVLFKTKKRLILSLVYASRAFTKAGYHIACIGRSAENLSKLGKEITEAGGYVSYLPCILEDSYI